MTGGPRKAGCRWILSQVLSMVIMDVDNHDVIWFEVLFPWTKNQVRWHDLPVETIGFWPFYFIWAAATGGAFSFPMNKESSEMAWSSCWNHRILALLLHLSSSHRRSMFISHEQRIKWDGMIFLLKPSDSGPSTSEQQPREEHVHFPWTKNHSEMSMIFLLKPSDSEPFYSIWAGCSDEVEGPESDGFSRKIMPCSHRRSIFPWTRNQVRWHDLPEETIGFWPFYFIWAAATGGAFDLSMQGLDLWFMCFMKSWSLVSG